MQARHLITSFAPSIFHKAYQNKTEMINLNNLLDNLQSQLSAQLPDHINKAFEDSIRDLWVNRVGESAYREGDTLPSFALTNAKGEIIESDTLLKNNERLVIAFFRGGWCPYCNLELKALQDILPRITEKKAALVAISPQSNEKSAAMYTDHPLGFDILADIDNKYAKELGIAFDVQDFVLLYYRQLGINLSEYNGNDDNNLPIPAVYVIDKNQTVTFSFIDANYTKRVNIELLLNSL